MTYPLLERIRKPGDVKELPREELPALASEIRRLIIDTVTRTGGHLASNLGAVELTIALHRVLQWPGDTLVWDVGHQCYTHKLLTGRAPAFGQLRTYRGLCGFPDPGESETDFLKTGHSSTSIATALGAACGSGNGHVVAVIGDASLGGGVAFEGLNRAATTKSNLCVVLNANEMAISGTTGGLALALTRLITNPYLESLRRHFQSLASHVPFIGAETAAVQRGLEEQVKNLIGPAAFFESMGLRYFGPFDGHNHDQLGEAFRKILPLEGPKLIHVVTRKGKGYPPAEADPESFHSVAPARAGESAGAGNGEAYGRVFSETLLARAAEDPRIVAITAAMAAGTGLKPFARKHPERFFDVGIAEQAALAFAAGQAGMGRRPVVAIYATFFQRALDQLFQEICLQGLPVVVALPNSGLVGEDGPTHHGVFSLSCLRCLPGLTIAAPFSRGEMARALEQALRFEHPAVILFPKDRGPAAIDPVETPEPEALVTAAGSAAENAARAVARLNNEGRRISFLPVSAIKPLDERITALAAGAPLVFTVEENSAMGGFGGAVLEELAGENIVCPVKVIGVPDRFVTFGSRADLLAETGLDEDGLYQRFRAELEGPPGGSGARGK